MATEGINPRFVLDGLREAVQALTAAGDVVLALVPDGTVKADKLALDFDNFGRAALESLESELTQAQQESLIAVDTHPTWQEVREATKGALADFGWDEGPPTPKRGYVLD